MDARQGITFAGGAAVALTQGTGRSVAFRALSGDVKFDGNSSMSTQGAAIQLQAIGLVRPGALFSGGGDVLLKATNIDI